MLQRGHSLLSTVLSLFSFTALYNVHFRRISFRFKQIIAWVMAKVTMRCREIVGMETPHSGWLYTVKHLEKLYCSYTLLIFLIFKNKRLWRLFFFFKKSSYRNLSMICSNPSM